LEGGPNHDPADPHAGHALDAPVGRVHVKSAQRDSEFDAARHNLCRHASYLVTAFIAGAS
jgi:hypothetical protein